MMNTNRLGSSPIVKGQLITLYIDDVENGRLQQAVILYAMQDFDLAEKMVEYYGECKNKQTLTKSEIMLPCFSDHLVEKGLVTHPSHDTVRLGTVGRPPARMIDEYKYSLNPNAFVEGKLIGLVNGQCNGVFGHRGHYFSLMNAEFCPYVVRCAIVVNNDHDITIDVGVSPSEAGVHPDADDCLKFQLHLQKLFSESLEGIPIHVVRVFPPPSADIAVIETMETLCKH